MDNSILANKTTLHKCLSLLPFDQFSSAYLDNSVKKLFTCNLLRIGIAMQLDEWRSYSEVQERILALENAQAYFGLSSISASQLSRRMNDLPTTYPQRLFFEAVRKLHTLSSQKGVASLGRLHLIDSSSLRLGPTLGKWAYVSRDKNGVKLHLRLVVASESVAYPDQVIPSTGNVDDREVVLELLTDPDATYLMDRGYVDYDKVDMWVDQGKKFIMRINTKHTANILETYEVPKDSRVKLDAEVWMGSKCTDTKRTVRLVEFFDDNGTLYRLITTRWDLTAEEIADAYRYRWMIELFFKWLKQHTKLIKLQSTKPQGIWNQIFFALTAFCLVLYIRLTSKTKKSSWKVLEGIRIYAGKAWDAFQASLHRKPSRSSLGRQKRQPREEERSFPNRDGGGVAMIKPVGEKRSKTAKYFK